MPWLLLLPVACLGAEEHSPGAESLYSVAAAREDFTYLYDTLQASSYDLFLSTPKAAYDHAFEQTLNSIDGPMTRLQLNRLFQRFAVIAGFSHCSLAFPSDDYQRFYQNSGRWLPLEITFQGDRVLVAVNWSGNAAIDKGDEILAINGQDIQGVLTEVYALTQGENTYAKRAFLETGSFLDIWWYAFGEFTAGTVKIRKPDGRILELSVEGIDLEQWRERSQAIPSPQFIKAGRTFKFINDVAYLRPGVFLNEENRDISSQEAFNTGEFLDFIESAFMEIAERQPQYLIVDIRGNNGGDNSFSDPMIAYFADQPFRIASRFSVRTSEVTKSFWKDIDIPKLEGLKQQIMTLENGSRFDIDLGATEPRNDALSFKGNVIALIDRFSFSNAAVVAAIIQDYEFGTLVGEETSYTPSSCAAIHTFNLPNTGMSAVFPKACSVRPNGNAALRGVVPDHQVSDDLFTATDEALEAALVLVGEEGNGSE